MAIENILILEDNFPLTERAFQIHGYKERGVNYCIISRYKNDGLIQSCENLLPKKLDIKNSL